MARFPDDAPEMDGTRFLLWIVLPVILTCIILFLAFKPDRPLGGPSRYFDPPPGADASGGEE